MAKVRIITDATVHLAKDLVDRHQIVVLPLEIRLGEEHAPTELGEVLTIGLGESLTELFRTMAGQAPAVHVSVSPSAFREAYRQLNQETDEILVVASSRKLSRVYDVGLVESRGFLGRCRIMVLDSMTSSWGLGLVVEAAARAANQGKNLDEIVRLVRGVLPHIYAILSIERMDYLEQGGRIGAAQALLGAMLRIKPLLIVEDGEIIALEKVRTRTAAMEKLVDFVAEFAAVEQAVILRSPLGIGIEEMENELREQLHEVLPGIEFPGIVYDPVLASQVGPEGLGVMVYEGF
jgi:DegV family protein with EDD domain